MSWTLLIQLMILAMWFSICGSVMFGTYAEKRFGKGKPTKCGRRCSEGHQYDEDCSL